MSGFDLEMVNGLPYVVIGHQRTRCEPGWVITAGGPHGLSATVYVLASEWRPAKAAPGRFALEQPCGERTRRWEYDLRDCRVSEIAETPDGGFVVREVGDMLAPRRRVPRPPAFTPRPLEEFCDETVELITVHVWIDSKGHGHAFPVGHADARCPEVKHAAFSLPSSWTSTFGWPCSTCWPHDLKPERLGSAPMRCD